MPRSIVILYQRTAHTQCERRRPMHYLHRWRADSNQLLYHGAGVPCALIGSANSKFLEKHAMAACNQPTKMKRSYMFEARDGSRDENDRKWVGASFLRGQCGFTCYERAATKGKAFWLDQLAP